ncbi:hypothetical protein MIND_00923700 [Mycena indigotica]|uniref:Uncharacterized protein n=1 Tax=Mycena indigotica TaxID=2126181 RepID=A0A8H6W2G1_9AGAR|nr:uncharacterized protein MIND_00923700 [Mycena indigotica]KAF7296919.1 hypothetical protein MIND_00923700 [Mycena indigotica]
MADALIFSSKATNLSVAARLFSSTLSPVKLDYLLTPIIMRFFTVVAVVMTLRAAAAVVVPGGGYSDCTNSEVRLQLVGRDDTDDTRDKFRNFLDNYESWSKDERRDFLYDIDPKTVDLEQEMLEQITKIPKVEKILDGKQLTNEMVVLYLKDMHKKDNKDE